MTAWLLGVDFGASGSRLALVPLTGGDPDPIAGRRLTGDRPSVGDGGSSAASVALELVAQALATWDDVAAEDVRGAAAGIAGLETNVTRPASYVPRLGALLPRARVVLCSDMVTAHLGALGTGGAVLAAGTGAVALGTDLGARWHRVDGWGHLIGDLGSGAWIGIRALQVGAAAADGRDRGGAALRDAVAESLGPVTDWPAAVYHRPDRSGALADLAGVVLECARRGDPAARAILDDAANHLAGTLLAALADGVPPVAALVGGLVSDESPVRELVAAEVARRRPDVELRPPAGTPLDGAVRLARLAVAGALPDGGPILR
jgi:N-acetylglucosamine kinase-like BadF-type ATPase